MTVLRDLLRPNLSLVICGSAVGRRSAELGHYYAGPGNRLWRTLVEVGLVSVQLAPGEARELLTFGIGLTDLVKDQSGGDERIAFRRAAADGLRAKIMRYRPRYLCFNGKRAAREFLCRSAVDYGLQEGRIGATRLFVAPSTSAAARRWWDISAWRDLADLVRNSAAV